MPRATTSRGARSPPAMPAITARRSVDQAGALAAHGLAGQRHRVGADRDGGRVELHELDVAQHGAGPGGQRQPLAAGAEGLVVAA